MENRDGIQERIEAEHFLSELRKFLTDVIPSRTLVMSKILEQASNNKKSQKDIPYENYFLRLFIIQNIFKYLVSYFNGDASKAVAAFACESYSDFKQFASRTPASCLKSPFRKVIGSSTSKIVRKWWDGKGENAVAEADPDLSLRAPYKIVFEAKYFRKGGIEAAKTSLVASIYQCFFYRDLPRFPGTKTRADWDYDYACLLAYDATEEQSLSKAWNKVRKDVKDNCWDGANIYVMILPDVP
jgi:hypothetical protein